MKNKTRKNPGRIKQIFIWLGTICTFITAFLIFYLLLRGVGDSWIFHRELYTEILEIPKGGVTVPLKEHGGRAFVSGLINGKQKLNMLVDTGCEVTTIDSSLLKELKHPIRLPLAVSAPDETRELQKVIIPELTIGELTFRSVPAVVCDMHGQSELEGYQINGILGNNIMSNFATTFDWQNKVVIFKASNNLNLSQQLFHFPFTDRGSPYITAKLCDKINQIFMIDTGDSTSQLPTAVAEQLSLRVVPFKGKLKYYGFGKLHAQGGVEMPKFSCDKLTAYNTWFNVEFSDGPAAKLSNLGYNFLKKFRLTIDQPNNSIKFESYVVAKVDELKERTEHYTYTNKTQEAINAIHKAIILAPRDVEIRLLYAKLLCALKLYPDCLRELTRCIKLGGEDEESYFLRALIYNELHNKNAAVQDIMKVASMFPNDPFTQIKCGLVLTQFSAPSLAIERLSYAAGLQPDIAQIYIARARAYEQLHEYKNVLLDYNIAIKINPSEAIYLADRAWFYNTIQKDFDKAIDDCNKAIKIDPNLADAYRNRGIAFIGKSDYPHAISDLDKSIKLDSTSERAGKTYYFRSLVYKQMGNNTAAEADGKQSQKLGYDPQNQ